MTGVQTCALPISIQEYLENTYAILDYQIVDVQDIYDNSCTVEFNKQKGKNEKVKK